MDDPILSLDEDHRERWSREILNPKLKYFQVILSTHQKQYLNHCGYIFESDYIIELNPRDHERQISWRPGHRLKCALASISKDWDKAKFLLRLYREDLLITLDSYSPVPFYNPRNLSNSFDEYEKYSEPHPLSGKNQRKIVAKFKDPKVSNVLDPSMHSLTESSITKPMVEDCLEELKICDNIFKNELIRLENLRKHRIRGSSIPASAILFEGIKETSWEKPININQIGRAAARPEDTWQVDISEEALSIYIPQGTIVLVTDKTLDPVAKCGQWVLLADESNEPIDGDLVAVYDSEKNRYLRRIWSDGYNWILQSINPIHPIPSITCEKKYSAIRKIIGVIYQPEYFSKTINPNLTLEWEPVNHFDLQQIPKYKAILVEGDSIDPIARKGQKVLVRECKLPIEALDVTAGSLAVIETQEDSGQGNLIKRIYPNKDHWILVSANPIDSISPISISNKEIKKIWPICGVLFETAD